MVISRLACASGLRRAQDAPLPVQVAADARAEREREVLEHALIEPDGAGRAQPAVLRRERALAEDRRRFAQEDDRAIDADDLAQEQQELLQQRRGIEAVREHAGETPQRLAAPRDLIGRSARLGAFVELRRWRRGARP